MVVYLPTDSGSFLTPVPFVFNLALGCVQYPPPLLHATVRKLTRRRLFVVVVECSNAVGLLTLSYFWSMYCRISSTLFAARVN